MAPEQFQAFRSRLAATYRTGSLADVMTLVTSEFPGKAHRLDDLFRDEQRRIIGIVLADRFEDYQRSFEHLANQDEEVLNRLGRLNYPIPKPFARRPRPTSIITSTRRSLGWNTATRRAIAAIERLHERGQAWRLPGRRRDSGKVVAKSLERILGGIHPEADLAAITARVELLLDASALLGIKPDLWQVQNQFLGAFLELSRATALDDTLRETFAELATRLNVSPSLLGWRP